MPSCNAEVVYPIEVLCEAQRSSTSSLIRASDGCEYIVKQRSSGQSVDRDIDEWIGAAALHSSGLPVPEWAAMRMGRTFSFPSSEIAANQSAVEKQPEDLYFATRRFSASTGRQYEILPGPWFSRVTNLSDFTGVLVADLWLGKNTPRHALFVDESETNIFKAVFINNGGLFERREMSGARSSQQCSYIDHRVYELRQVQQLVDCWVERIVRNSAEVISKSIESLPSLWRTRRALHCERNMAREIARLGKAAAEAASALERNQKQSMSAGSRLCFGPYTALVDGGMMRKSA